MSVSVLQVIQVRFCICTSRLSSLENYFILECSGAVIIHSNLLAPAQEMRKSLNDFMTKKSKGGERG